MNAHDLIRTAEELASSADSKPRQSNLRRSASTTYYALFHFLARGCADMLIGGAGAVRSKSAWRQVYRSLDHSEARKACLNKIIEKFPQQIQDFAICFAALQEKRHRADYDPYQRVRKSEVLSDIAQAVSVMSRFNAAPVKDRRAFAAFILFKTRQN